MHNKKCNSKVEPVAESYVELYELIFSNFGLDSEKLPKSVVWRPLLNPLRVLNQCFGWEL